MAAQKNTAPGLGTAHVSNSFVLKILPVTHFDSGFCEGKSESIAPNVFISKILRKRYIKNIFDLTTSVLCELLPIRLCVE
jgi:hypothetical protein